MVKHQGFTLIELLIAIVIAGFAISSMTMIMFADIDQRAENYEAEGIFALSTKLNQILTYQWDENSLQGVGSALDTESILPLPTGVANAPFARSTTTFGTATLGTTTIANEFRVGSFQEPKHRKFTPTSNNATVSAVLGSDGGDSDDIDDFIGQTPLLQLAEATGYKNLYRTVVTVSYADDGSTGNSNIDYTGQTVDFNLTTTDVNRSNLKRVRITLQRSSDFNPATATYEDIAQLDTYVANIGESDIFYRYY